MKKRNRGFAAEEEKKRRREGEVRRLSGWRGFGGWGVRPASASASGSQSQSLSLSLFITARFLFNHEERDAASGRNHGARQVSAGLFRHDGLTRRNSLGNSLRIPPSENFAVDKETAGVQNEFVDRDLNLNLDLDSDYDPDPDVDSDTGGDTHTSGFNPTLGVSRGVAANGRTLLPALPPAVPRA